MSPEDTGVDDACAYQRRLDVRIRNVGGALLLQSGAGQLMLEDERKALWLALDGHTSLAELHSRLGTGTTTWNRDMSQTRGDLAELLTAGMVAPAADTAQDPPAGPALRVQDLDEKDFITSVLSRYADTARYESFEDCVVIELGGTAADRPVLVLNVDHPSFTRPRFTGPGDYRFYGRWVAAATCSDVICMGVRPIGFAVDLAVPLELPVVSVEAIYDGMAELLTSYGTALRGGNVDANDLELVGVAWGLGRHDRLIRRQGAAAGDAVIATCDLGRGWSRYLLQRLNLTESVPASLWAEADGYADQVRTPIEPILRCADSAAFSSGMDLSDGVLEFCHTIAGRNGLGVEVIEHGLGSHPLVSVTAELLGVRPAMMAMDPGYDFPYSHGYTVPEHRLAEVSAMFAEHGQPMTVVGRVTDEPGVRLRRLDDTAVELPMFWSDQTDTGGSRVDRWMRMARQL